jgi:hypothetical protein
MARTAILEDTGDHCCPWAMIRKALDFIWISTRTTVRYVFVLAGARGRYCQRYGKCKAITVMTTTSKTTVPTGGSARFLVVANTGEHREYDGDGICTW